MNELEDMKWAQWPKVTPRPTPEELEVARERYQKTLDHHDDSDWPCGLEFVMTTYNRELWWRFFFPEEGEAMFKKLLDSFRDIAK